MRDFTLVAYTKYIDLLLKSELPIYLFRELMCLDKQPKTFCLIRHDVDRKPKNALNMARIEADKGVKSTYYFRTKSSTFKPEIIKSIYRLGHEIGYHYESLSDTDGDIDKALIDFKKNLNKLREVVPVKTCSMHGRPLKPHDNRDIWKIEKNHKQLCSQFGIIGEVYLDIDYSDIAYINDTGRNWTSGASNRRDKVNSKIFTDFENQKELLKYLSQDVHSKLVFQIHPERWSDNVLEWGVQYLKDQNINLAKWILQKRRS